VANYYFSNKAVEDLDKIWNYSLETWSESQADKYYDLLIISCNDLAKNPKLGKQYDIVTKGMLGYKSGEHIIFYCIVSTNEIEIVRILHGMMDLKTKL
jgi:toxin ParE1/3/4